MLSLMPNTFTICKFLYIQIVAQTLLCHRALYGIYSCLKWHTRIRQKWHSHITRIMAQSMLAKRHTAGGHYHSLCAYICIFKYSNNHIYRKSNIQESVYSKVCIFKSLYIRISVYSSLRIFKSPYIQESVYSRSQIFSGVTNWYIRYVT